MRLLTASLLIFLVGNFFTTPAPVFAETEPNNTIAQANTIAVGYASGHVDAMLSSTTDVDFYKFTAAANQTFVIETYNIAGTGYKATGLWLYTSSNTLLADDDYGTGSGNVNARIVFRFTTAGTYYIKVAYSSYGTWTGSYSLRVLPKYDQTGAGWNTSDNHEPNDVREIANAISVGYGQAVTRTLFDATNFVSYYTDVDYYRFTVSAGQTYVIETFNIDGSGYKGTGLWLYNSSGSLLADDDYGTGSGNVNARITFTFSTAGTYFVMVAESSYGPWTGTYSFRVLPKYDQPGAGWNANQDYEPNDVIPIANLVNPGLANSVTRELFDSSNFISSEADQDFYRFNAVSGKQYSIETFNADAVDGRATGLWLYNSTGTLLIDDDYGSNGDDNVDARITFTFTTAGTYFVRVAASSYGDWNGTYSFRVCQNSCLAYIYLPMTRR